MKFMRILNIILLVSGVKPECFRRDASKFDFLCPLNYNEVGGFEISVTALKEISIQCDHLFMFNVSELPQIQLNRINSLQFRFCPLPQNGFKDILDWFDTKEVTVLEFEYGISKNQSLNSKIFANLQHLKFLKISKSKFEKIENDFLRNTPNLIALELKDDSLNKLDASYFKNLNLLEWLDLSINQIEKIPRGVFKFLDSLEYLRLWNNQITNIEDLSFEGLTNLRYLDLSVNKISTISETAFENLKNLANLSLATNLLTRLPENLFKKNYKLQSVLLNNNPGLELDNSTFANFDLLEEIDLSNCDLKQIPETLFQNSLELKNINLCENNIKTLPNNLFQGLFYLEKLDLSKNHLKNVNDIFTSLRKLKILNLENNLLGSINEFAFSDLIRLEELNLAKNKIEDIHPNAFFNNERIRIIDLSENLYAGRDVVLKDLLFLEEVYFRENFLSQIEHLIDLYNKAYLKILDLRNNNISSIWLQHLQSLSEVEIYLQNNKISTVRFEDLDIIEGTHKSVLSLDHNPIKCDCHNYDLFRYFNGNVTKKVTSMFEIRKENVICAEPKNLENKFLALLPLEASVCPIEDNVGCPQNCSCFWRSSDMSLIVDCHNKNLTNVPNLQDLAFHNFSQTELNLRNNQLSWVNFSTFDTLTKILLAGNRIEHVYGLPKNLRVLELYNNNLTAFNPQIFTYLNFLNLQNLTLGQNPWICTCETHVFSSFMRQHTKQIDVQNVLCSDSNLKVIDLDAKSLCQDFTYLYFLALMLIVLSVPILYYRFQEEMKVWLFARSLCLCWVSEEDLDKEKIYDAFISYSSKDEDFVISTLVKTLEESSEEYKLCLHLRDWFPGELISTHIVNSIVSSKRTIVVLSANFLQSVWAKAEFQKAHAEAMANGRARVIVIVYGNLDLDEIDDTELKVYLKTNTYLKWGDQYFWEKLKYALPHRKRHNKRKNEV